MTIVYKYGALPPAKDGSIRNQIKLAREYYNKLIEAENKRRSMAWGQDLCPRPDPHEHPEKGKCSMCVAHYKAIRDKYFALAPLDVKPLRAVAADSGLYWGTYLMVEESFSAAWKKTKPTEPVRFRSWKQGGVMGVQLQKRRPLSAVTRVSSITDNRTGRRANQRQSIKIRVGTRERNIPVWSDAIEFEKHRQILGDIAWVKVCLSFAGEREIWSVQFVAKNEPASERATDKYVAIDVGWRVMSDDSLRIAYAHGSDNIDCQLTMPARWRELADRADRIRAERDRRLNELKKSDNRFSMVKYPGRVSAVIRRDKIVPGSSLTEWVRRDRHLAQYELGCRRRSVAARRDALRVWISKLRKQYKVAIIKDSSHKELKEHKKAVADGMTPPARRNGHHGAPGEVIEEICRSFGRAENVSVVEAQNTTATCPICGEPIEVDAGLIVKCERCHGDWDRDYVSTRNIEKLYLTGDIKKPTARKTTAKFAKRHKVSASTETMAAQCL